MTHLEPIPLTTDPTDPDSPEGALPVTIHGIGGGDSTPVAWNEVTGKPSTFPPATHTHTVAQVDGLQSTLDSLENKTVAWGDVTGKPSTFAPATHTHTVAQVDGLQTIINDLTSRIQALESAAE